jgi:hypothetical protein
MLSASRSSFSAMFNAAKSGGSGSGGASQSPLDARLNESSLTHIAILLSYFFGADGLTQFRLKVSITLGFLSLFALASISDMLSGGWVTTHLAIHSREAAGLAGILFAPFLHPSPAAAFIDCAPFMLLSLLVMVSGRSRNERNTNLMLC